MTPLAIRIVDCIERAGRPLKARTIANELSVERSVINSLLYGKLAHLVVKDAEHSWSLRSPDAYPAAEQTRAVKLEEALAHQSVEPKPSPTVSRSDQNAHQLTPRQRAFLVRDLREFPFSTRVVNVLKVHSIRRVGDLIQLDPEDILELQNAGRRSVEELRAFLRTEGLTLGLKVPDWSEALVKAWIEELPSEIESARSAETPPVRHARSPVRPTSDENREMTVRQRAFLMRHLSEFSFSTRVTNVLKVQSIRRVGDLAQLTQHDILGFPNLGRRSVEELEVFLRTEGLAWGLNVPGWNRNLVKAWEEELRSEIEVARNIDALGTGTTKLSSPISVEVELGGIVRQVWGTQHRNAEITCSVFGWDGAGAKTLEQVGDAFGVTRERVRQIRNNFLRRIRNKRMLLPKVVEALELLESISPAVETEARNRLVSAQLCGPKFQVTGLLTAQEIAGRTGSLSIGLVDGITIIGTPGVFTSAHRAVTIARAAVSRKGCVHVEEIGDHLSSEGIEKLPVNLLVALMGSQKGVRWLSPDQQWLTFDDSPRNRLINVIRKVLSVSPSVHVNELRAALKRVHRLQGFVPSRAVLREFCGGLGICKLERDIVTATASEDPSEVLGKTELLFYQILTEHGNVMSSFNLERECLKRGLNNHTFFQYISYSPIMLRLARAVYSLTGAPISPGTVEALTPPRVQTKTREDHGWTADGKPWVTYRLNRGNIRSGVFSIPTAFRTLISGEYRLAAPEEAHLGIARAERDRMTSLRRAISLRGGDEGDLMLIIFDLAARTAAISIGDEDTTEIAVTVGHIEANTKALDAEADEQ